MGQHFLYISYSRINSIIEVIGTGTKELFLIRIQPAIKKTDPVIKKAGFGSDTPKQPGSRSNTIHT